MIPPRSFPKNILTLVELEEGKVVHTHEKLPSSNQNRERLYRMRNDMLMINPKLDLQVRENNA